MNAQFKNVLILFLILGSMLVTGGTIWAFFGGTEIIAKLGMPPIVEASGSIMMDGVLLPAGQITTYPEDERLPGAVAFVNTSGMFQFETDVNGQWVTGAYAGKHKVTVQVRRRKKGEQGPELLLNDAYADKDRTPLTLTVARDPNSPANMTLLLELTGGLREVHESEDPEPEARRTVELILRTYDFNHNKQLEAGEQEKIEADRQKALNLAEHDANQDGIADENELMASARRLQAKDGKFKPVLNERAERQVDATPPMGNPVDQSAEMNARYMEAKIFGFYDLDFDDRLSKEELDKIDFGFRNTLAAGDQDKDGFVGAEELHKYLVAMGRELMLRTMGKSGSKINRPRGPSQK